MLGHLSAFFTDIVTFKTSDFRQTQLLLLLKLTQKAGASVQALSTVISG